MYDERIENLIELALVDGQLTLKEREVLIKRALEAGVDKDEFEMVLDARLYQKNQELSKTSNSSVDIENSSDFISSSGDQVGKELNTNISKCPSCGGNLPTYSTKCLDCGHEVAERQNNASIQKLFEILQEIESQRKERQTSSNPFAALGNFYAETFSNVFGPNAIERKKMEAISSFPIPTTKGDILEFLAHAFPRAKEKGNFFTKNDSENKVHNELVPVWKTKCEQIIIKSRFALKHDQKTLDEINYYAKQLQIK